MNFRLIFLPSRMSSKRIILELLGFECVTKTEKS